MSAETASNLKFDIGHVLFIDIVGYSKGLINEQSESLQKLKEIGRSCKRLSAGNSERITVCYQILDAGYSIRDLQIAECGLRIRLRARLRRDKLRIAVARKSFRSWTSPRETFRS